MTYHNPTGRCEVCGAETTRRYCSARCRMRHMRETRGIQPRPRYTAKKRTQAEIDQAVEAIAARDLQERPRWFLRKYQQPQPAAERQP